MPPNEREILEQARAKITAKQYREARQLLQRIPNNPTATKWISKIDQMLLQRSDNPPRERETVAINPNTTKPLPDELVRTTQPPKKSSGSGLTTLLRGIFGFLVAALLLYALGSQRADPIEDVLNFLNPQQTFSDSRITLTRSTSWEQNETSTHGWCGGVSNECLYFIKTSPNIGLLFTYVPLTNPSTPGEIAESNWQSELSDTVFVKSNRSLQDLTIAGIPAVAQMYTQSEKDENGGEFYMVDIYLVDGLDSYVINSFANTPCNLQRGIQEVNSVLSTLRVASQNGLAGEDGYSSASQVALTIRRVPVESLSASQRFSRSAFVHLCNQLAG